MKTIKVGFDVGGWRYQITCHYCQSELEIEAKDLNYFGSDGDWHDSGWETYTFHCPECGTNLTVPSTKIPNMVKVAAQKRKKK